MPSVYDKAASLKESKMAKDGIIFKEEEGAEEVWRKTTHIVMGSAVVPELSANGESQVRVPDWLSNSGKFDTADLDYCNLQDNYTKKLANDRRRQENSDVAAFQAAASQARDEAALHEARLQASLLGKNTAPPPTTTQPPKKRENQQEPAARTIIIKRKKIGAAPAPRRPPATTNDDDENTSAPARAAAPASTAAPGLGGLVGYGSDDDSD